MLTDGKGRDAANRSTETMARQPLTARTQSSLGTAGRIWLVAIMAGALLLGAPGLLTLLVVPYAAVGVVLATRRPANSIGWILCGIAIAGALAGLGWLIDAVGLPIAWTAVVQSVSAILSLGLLFLLTIVFPSGRLPGGRWGGFIMAELALWVLAGVVLLVAPTIRAGGALVPNPLGIIPANPAIEALTAAFTGTTAVALLLTGMSSMLVRLRRSTGVERQQLKWVIASLAALAIGLAVSFLGALVVGDRLRDAGWLVFSLAIITLPMPPIAVGIAVMRYRLYEIDRIVNRALVFGTLAAILAGVFAAGAGVTERLFVALTGQSSDAGLVVATLVVATLYAPLRKRLETIVDRRMKYAEARFGPYREELERFLSLVDAARAARRLALEASRELDARGCAVVDEDDRPTATAGEWPLPPIVRLAIPGGRGSLKTILVGPRRDGRPHDSRALDQLQELAQTVVEAVHFHSVTT